jgi:type II secretory pathway component PulJ
MRRAFTLIEALVSLFIVVTVLGLLIPAILAAAAREGRKTEEVRDKSFYLHTERHDGHMWVLNRTMDYFVHHPDCPCHGKAERDDQGR